MRSRIIGTSLSPSLLSLFAVSLPSRLWRAGLLLLGNFPSSLHSLTASRCAHSCALSPVPVSVFNFSHPTSLHLRVHVLLFSQNFSAFHKCQRDVVDVVSRVAVSQLQCVYIVWRRKRFGNAEFDAIWLLKGAPSEQRVERDCRLLKLEFAVREKLMGVVVDRLAL